MKIKGWKYERNLGPVLGTAIYYVLKYESNHPMIRCMGYDPRGVFTTWDITENEYYQNKLIPCEFQLNSIG